MPQFLLTTSVYLSGKSGSYNELPLVMGVLLGLPRCGAVWRLVPTQQKRPAILSASGRGGKGSLEQVTDGHIAGKGEESMAKSGSRNRREQEAAGQSEGWQAL